MKLHRNIRLLALFNFLTDLRLYYPVAILYFTKVSGSYALGMSIFSLATISSALFEVPTGIYSDMIGRKKTLVWGALFSLMAVILYALGKSYYFLALGAVVEGVAYALYSGNNDALLMHSLIDKGQKEEYAKYYGKVNSFVYWALAVVAVLGGVLANFSFSLVMWLSVIPVFLAFVVSFFVIEPKTTEKSGNIYAHLKDSLVLFKTNYSLRMLSLSKIVGYARSEAGYQFRAVFINSVWPMWAVGFEKMLTNVVAALSSYFAGKIIKRFKPEKVLFLGRIYSVIANVVATIYPTVISPLILASTAIFQGTNSAASSTLLQGEYTNKLRATMSSINSLAGSLLFAVVAFGLGLVADKLDPAKALLSLQVLGVLSAWFLFKAINHSLFRKNDR